MPKFMVAVNGRNYDLIEAEAKLRGVTVQDILRVIVIPEWLARTGQLGQTGESGETDEVDQSRNPDKPPESFMPSDSPMPDRVAGKPTL